MGDAVAVLLDDAMPPERLGELLREARRRKGWKRSRAASRAGIPADRLRAYERGKRPVPERVVTALAECYGDDLCAHVPLRVPVRANEDWLVVGDYEQPLMTGSADEIVAGYVKIVQRLRNEKPGAPLSLRGDDLIVLAHALGTDPDAIEAKIAEVLGCTRDEARALHNDLLRRKVLVPVAGLAAGIAALGTVAYATQGAGASSAPPATAVTLAVSAHHAPHASRPVAPASPTTVAATVAAAVVDPTPTTEAPAPPTTVAVRHTSAIVPAPPHTTDATVPADERAADVPQDITPHADPNDPPVSILPGETPITIIGSPDSVP